MKNYTELTPEQKWEQATIANEEVIDIDHDAKSIRLDVYVKEADRVYDIEIQLADTKELPERARFYSSAIDLDTLTKGKSFKNLPESHVIFICMKNIFNTALPVYTFENICIEDGTKLNDRSYKHFFIAPTCAKMIENKEVRSFFEFLISNKAQTGYTSDLSKYVADAKHNTQWRLQYMTVETLERYAYENGLEHGLAEGQQQKAIEDALMLIKEYNETPEVAAQKMKAPLDKVIEAYNSISAVL